MSNTLKTRISQKHDIEANWLKAINFIPLKGEIIVYDEDENNPVPRLKIGNGVDNVNDLPFIGDEMVEDWHPMEVGDTITKFRWNGVTDSEDIDTIRNSGSVCFFSFNDSYGTSGAMGSTPYDSSDGAVIYINAKDNSWSGNTDRRAAYPTETVEIDLLSGESSEIFNWTNSPVYAGVTSITINEIADWAKPYLQVYKTIEVEKPELIKEGYGENSIQGISATAAGSKAFKITDFDPTAQTYTLSDAESLFECFKGLQENDSIRVSIQLKKNYDDCGVITSIERQGESDEYIVKLDTFCYTEGEDVIQEGSHLRALDYPELGTFRFGTAATAFGYETKASAIGALSSGYNTEAHGKYSTAFGNTTKAGYAATALGRDTNANGRMSLAIGDATEALGQCTVAGGYGSVASADGSLAIGHSATADGYYATSRGLQTKANGEYSTALGVRTETGARALASGTDTKATGKNSVAVGNNTKASGENSFAEGVGSIASSENSHAEGDNTLAAAAASHAQGRNTKAEGVGSSASGVGSTAKGWAATAEGSSTLAKGNHSHAGGLNSQSNGDASFAHGSEVHANGAASTAIGLKTNANGAQSFASGYDALADAALAFAHGDTAKALGTTSVALGARTTAKGNFALAAPYSSKVASDITDLNLSKEELLNAWRNSPAYNRFNLAKGNFSLALGRDCAALGDGSVALGYENVVKEWGSVAAGHNLISTGATQTVVGKFNNPDASHVFQVGGGTSDTNRKNAFWVKADGTTSLDEKIAAAGGNYYLYTGGQMLDVPLPTGTHLAIDSYNYFLGDYNNYSSYSNYFPEGYITVDSGDTIVVYTENIYSIPRKEALRFELESETIEIIYHQDHQDNGWYIDSVTKTPKFVADITIDEIDDICIIRDKNNGYDVNGDGVISEYSVYLESADSMTNESTTVKEGAPYYNIVHFPYGFGSTNLGGYGYINYIEDGVYEINIPCVTGDIQVRV